MIYVVSNQTSFFSKYQRISIQESKDIISKWNSIQFDSETLGKDPHVGKPLSAQFGAPDKSIQIVVDWTTVDIREYKEYLGVCGLDITITDDMDIEWQQSIILLNQLKYQMKLKIL